MSAETEFRSLWNGFAVLTRQLPLTRLSTGTTICETYPFGVLRQGETHFAFWTNQGFLRINTPLELTVRAESRNTLDALVSALDTALATTTAFQKTKSVLQCLQNGVWEWTITLNWKGRIS